MTTSTNLFSGLSDALILTWLAHGHQLVAVDSPQDLAYTGGGLVPIWALDCHVTDVALDLPLSVGSCQCSSDNLDGRGCAWCQAAYAQVDQTASYDEVWDTARRCICTDAGGYFSPCDYCCGYDLDF